MSEICIQTSDTNTLPPVAPQQGVDAFRNMFAILHNLDRDELAGVVTSDDSWRSFNDEPTRFILKLDDARLDALYALVQKRQPARYRTG